jgi:dTDP-4-dehydrorhamnose 3,5-epimerase
VILTRTAIADVLLVTQAVFGDARGYFMETWHAEKFAAAGLELTFVQDNQSVSGRGTLRGLHYQIRHPQGKLIRVVTGEIFDVAVDLRRSSPTFGKWVGATLSGENKIQLYVPPGFAHGFLVTSESAMVVYKCTDFYHPKHERTLLWNDADLAIDWPLASGSRPLLSGKDMDGKPLGESESYA